MSAAPLPFGVREEVGFLRGQPRDKRAQLRDKRGQPRDKRAQLGYVAVNCPRISARNETSLSVGMGTQAPHGLASPSST